MTISRREITMTPYNLELDPLLYECVGKISSPDYINGARLNMFIWISGFGVAKYGKVGTLRRLNRKAAYINGINRHFQRRVL